MKAKILSFFHWIISLFAASPKPEQAAPELDKWDKNRALHKQLKESWDIQQRAAQLPTAPLTEYCVDALGNVYYINAAGLDINVDRVFAIERAMLGVFHGIDDDYIFEYFRLVDKALADNNLAQIRALHNDFKMRKNKLPAMQKMLHLACLYLYRHDENPYSLDLALQQNKLETAMQIPELRAFFLRLSWGVIVKKEQELPRQQHVWSNRSETDFLAYSAGVAPIRANEPDTN